MHNDPLIQSTNSGLTRAAVTVIIAPDDFNYVPLSAAFKTHSKERIGRYSRTPIGLHHNDVIMEYLNETACGGSNSPENPLERAQMQMFARYADTYLSPGGLFGLFKLVGQGGGAHSAEEELAALHAELARLERILTVLPDFRERAIHLGDMALVPHMDFVLLLGPLFGEPAPLSKYPMSEGWFNWAKEDPAVAGSSSEMCDAVAKLFGS